MQFLPPVFDPLGTYPDGPKVQAHTRAFVVLCHAEVESYLEGWAKELARAAESTWTNAKRATLPFTHMLATLAQRIDLPVSFQVQNARDGPQRLEEEAVKLFQRYYKLVRDNNGVKEHNVLSLFGPLGVPSIAYGTTLLQSLDAFGSARGTLAHQSVRSVQATADPETEFNKIRALLVELEVLDTWLAAYRRQIR